MFGRLKPGVTIEQATAGLQPWFTSMLESDARLEGFPSAAPDRFATTLRRRWRCGPPLEVSRICAVRWTRPLLGADGRHALLLLLACPTSPVSCSHVARRALAS